MRDLKQFIYTNKYFLMANIILYQVQTVKVCRCTKIIYLYLPYDNDNFRVRYVSV